MLKWADLFQFILKYNQSFKLKLLLFVSKLQVLIFEFLQFRILEILNFHSCGNQVLSVGVCIQVNP